MLFKSGRLLQGGRIAAPGDGGSKATITFKKAYKTTNYSMFLNMESTGSDCTYEAPTVKTKSVNSATIYTWCRATWYSGNVYWMTTGMA